MVRKIDRDTYDPEGIILDRIQASAAGQLPSGFDLSSLYQARQHPKGLQMTVFGMSDALGQLGIEWAEIQDRINPDEVADLAEFLLSEKSSSKRTTFCENAEIFAKARACQ